MFIYLVIGTLLLLMAIVTAMLVTNWKKWTPILGKIAEMFGMLYGLAIGSVILYFISKELFASASEFFDEYAVDILSVILTPLSVIFVILSYIGIYFLLNSFAQPASNKEEEKIRSSAVGCAMFIGGTLNLALVGLFLEFGPFASAYEIIDRYSRVAGLDDGLVFAFTALLSCWSLIPLVYKRIRPSTATKSFSEPERTD